MKFISAFTAATFLAAGPLLAAPPSIQVIQNKAVLDTSSMPISVGNFPTSILGNYEALLKGQNGAPFGVLKLTTGKNVWTASLETLGQAKRTAKGSYTLQQGSSSASFEVKFAATKTAPAITLNFTLNGDSHYLNGSHNTGTLVGFKMIDSLANATKPLLYNLIMDQGTVDALDKPAGKGWASGSFAKTGIGTFKGILGDATACSFPLRLSVTGQAILWAQPYANKNSYIGGVVDLVDLVPNANNYEALEPRVSWVKVADAKTLSYPGGFSFDDLSVSGSRWIVPATHKALGESLGWLGGEKCTVRIYGAGLSNEYKDGAVKLPTEFTLNKTFKLTVPISDSTIKWSGKVMKANGSFSGSLNFPQGLAANTIAGSGAVSGLLVQEDKWGITSGLGLIKVPISGAKGSFRTAALTFEQYEANTAPSITRGTDPITHIGNSTIFPFTVNDIHTNASSLTFSASSSNTTLVPNANIVLGGSGAKRTVTVTPASGQSGTATITVTVSNGWLSNSETFVLTVNYNIAPSISKIAAQTINENDTADQIAFTIDDTQTAAGSLTVSGSSNNTTLVPNANIVFGGSGANRTVTVTPAKDQSGTATITVTVSDGSLTMSNNFVLTVNSSPSDNSAPTISDIAPHNISQGSNTGAISFTIGDAQTAAGSLTLSASSSNTTLVPNANIVFGGSGANRTVTVTPASGQGGTATITVTVSDGSLTMSNNFVLTVNSSPSENSAPTISDIAAQTITQGGKTGALAFTIGDAQTAAGSLTLSGSSNNTTLVPNANIVFGGSGADRTVTVTPASSQTGTATITVTVNDGPLSSSDTFLLTVNSAGPAHEGMALIPQGSFTMGNSAEEADPSYDGPTRTVTLDAFYMGKYEVTKAEWDEVRTWGLSNGYTDLAAGWLKESNHPVHSINWYNMVKWCNARSQKEGLTPVYYTDDAQTTIYKTGSVDVTNAQVNWAANGYRLPTEAEWEKAARGGLSGKRFPWGDTISHSQANYKADLYSASYDLSKSGYNHHPSYSTGSMPYTSPVGAFAANSYGLYDMAGNVSEWCWDWHDTYAAGSQTNPRGSTSGGYGAYRVFRGGDWDSSAYACRVSNRNYVNDPKIPDNRIGFRVVRSSTPEDGNHAPTISDITSEAQNIRQGSNTAAIAFTIGDAETAAGSLTLRGSSSNTTLVPNANILFGGSGANRTVTVTPASSQTGTATITVTVYDGSLSSSGTSFLLTVFSAGPAPAGMALIPQGPFTMGDDLVGQGDAPIHTVTLDAFYMGKYEVTKAEWDEVRTWGLSNGYTDLRAGSGKASNHPVHSISWYNMVKWCNARSQKEGLTPVYYTDDAQTTIYKTGSVDVTNAQVNWAANGYRLPTEAEWEKAARGGLSGKRFPWGDTISHSQANYFTGYLYSASYDLSNLSNSRFIHHPSYSTGSMPYTSPVGAFAANGYGLYDMAGNVSEWCWDWYGAYYAGSDTNPRGNYELDGYYIGHNRVRRGGDWSGSTLSGAPSCGVASRGTFGPVFWEDDIGFRVARSSAP